MTDGITEARRAAAAAEERTQKQEAERTRALVDLYDAMRKCEQVFGHQNWLHVVLDTAHKVKWDSKN